MIDLPINIIIVLAIVALVSVVVALAVHVGARGRGRVSEVAAPARRVEARADPAMVRRAHALIFIGFASGFALTANISAYIQLNLDYARADIPLLYLVASAVSLVTTRLGSRSLRRLRARQRRGRRSHPRRRPGPGLAGPARARRARARGPAGESCPASRRGSTKLIASGDHYSHCAQSMDGSTSVLSKRSICAQ